MTASTMEPATCLADDADGVVQDAWLVMIATLFDDFCIGVFETEQRAVEFAGTLSREECEVMAREIAASHGRVANALSGVYVTQPGASERNTVAIFDEAARKWNAMAERVSR